MKRGVDYEEVLKSFAADVAEVSEQISRELQDPSSSPARMREIVAKLLSVSGNVSAMINSNACAHEGGMKSPNKKRKMERRCEEKMKMVKKITVVDGEMDDGYSWRKYGQKDILGSNNPRGYFRCSHRPSHGCSAVKQVQRSDENPRLTEITYRGVHTCSAGNGGYFASGGDTTGVKVENWDAGEQSPFSSASVAVDFSGGTVSASSILPSPTASVSNFLSSSPMNDFSDTMDSFFANFSTGQYPAGEFLTGELDIDYDQFEWPKNPDIN